MKKVCVGALALMALSGSVFGAVDGTYKGSYGSALSVQMNPTQFGDSNLGSSQFANGSELDAAYCSSSAGNVNLLLTGNVESNFNKLVIFIDSGGGGQHTITGSAGLPGNYNGLTFDAGFNATHWMIFNGDGNNWYTDGGVIGGGGGFMGQNNGQGGGVLGGGSNILNALIAINNSNTLGVTSGSGAGALTALNGVEIQIPLATLGLSSANFKITAFINGGGHDFASNQWLGSLPAGFGNLGNNGSGGLSNIDLSQIAGNQYVQLPAPGAAAMLGLGGLLVGRRRR